MAEAIDLFGVEKMVEEPQEQSFDFLEHFLQMITDEEGEEELVALYNRHKGAFARSITVQGLDLIETLVDAWQADKNEAEDIGPCFSEAAAEFFAQENPEEKSPFEEDAEDLESSWMIEAAYRDLIAQLGFEPE
jgi:hypothetical protein